MCFMSTDHHDHDAFSVSGHERVFHAEIPVDILQHGDEDLSYLEEGLRHADEFLDAPTFALNARQKSQVRTKLVKLLRAHYGDGHPGSLHAFVDMHIPPLIWEVKAIESGS